MMSSSSLPSSQPPVRIISFNENNEIIFNEKGWEQLVANGEKDALICVGTICGSLRSGKSTILTKFLNVEDKKLNIQRSDEDEANAFQARWGREAVTQGMWVRV